jgi:PAS domain S-box-containing protein
MEAMQEIAVEDLLTQIKDLQNRLEESEQLIEAIKAGEVDAFAINGEKNSEIFTLQSGDYVYRILIEEFGEGAINVTEDGIIVYTNRYFFNLVKLPFEKLLGISIFDFIHKDSAEEFKEIFNKALTGSSKGEIKLFVDGKTIPVYISLTSLKPNLSTVGIIVTDVSQKKKDEEIILKYQNELELNNFELVNRNADLASFSYVASHDLQEPLRKIQTFGSLLYEKEKENLSEAGKDYLIRMQSASNRMQNLIEDLLTYSRTNTVERKFVETNLGDIIQEVLYDLKEDIEQINAIVEVKEMCSVCIIPFQFRQLFHNLINNSLKFAHPNHQCHIKIYSEIVAGASVSAKKLFQDVNYCHLKISDNGIGFEMEYNERIFELFQRLHGKGKYKGTGIGLAIVKKIVDNHNGVIIANSEINKGATFDIYIPLEH